MFGSGRAQARPDLFAVSRKRAAGWRLESSRLCDGVGGSAHSAESAWLSIAATLALGEARRMLSLFHFHTGLRYQR